MSKRYGEKGHVIVFARAPRLGRVKTRLARDVGAVTALRLYRNMLAHTLQEAAKGPWKLWLAATPPDAVDKAGKGLWPARHVVRGADIFPQAPGDLGQRMMAALAKVAHISRDGGPIVLVGADIPDLNARHLAQALRQARRFDVVYGPATDGGFWLIGMRQPGRWPSVFRNVRWSHPQTLNDCRGQARGLGASVGLAAVLSDMDELQSTPKSRKRSKATGRPE